MTSGSFPLSSASASPAPIPVSELHAGIQRALRGALKGDPPHGGAEAYLGSPVPVLGLRVPELNILVRTFRQANPKLSPAAYRQLARQLWNGPTFEERAVGIMLLAHRPLVTDPVTWRLVRGWPDAATGWGLSDTVSLQLISPAVAASSERFREVQGWTTAPSLWRRRASLYAMAGLVRSGEVGRPLAQIHRLRRDPERWVQRAVGTWLRECWKQDADRTERYMLANAKNLTPTAITVGTERASRTYRERLRAVASLARETGSLRSRQIHSIGHRRAQRSSSRLK
ncbi:MAG: DNA alkylation repair protein [Thermoplasmata archaeon]|nr:DNA alkylation repair protein [Thermoplasmata archaeon]